MAHMIIHLHNQSSLFRVVASDDPHAYIAEVKEHYGPSHHIDLESENEQVVATTETMLSMSRDSETLKEKGEKG